MLNLKLKKFKEEVAGLNAPNPIYKLNKSELDCNCKSPVLTKGGKDNVYPDNARQAVISVQADCGVLAANVSKVFQIVAEYIFGTKIKDKLPCKQTVLNMMDEGYALS